MYIDTLRLSNFRNYEKLDFHPSSGLNLLIGRNAQGKSAVLEAIYFLATSKSHRTSRDMDLIRIGESNSRVFAEVNRSERNEVTLEIDLSKAEKKTVKINTVKHPKIGDIVGQLNAVIFSSADIDMVKGEPSRRRRFLNLEVSQIRPQYVYALGRYKRVLDQRNNLLREIKQGTAQSFGLDVWDRQLVTYGAIIIAKRAEFVRFLSDAAIKIYGSFTQDTESLEITYKSNIDITSKTDIEATITEQEIAEKFYQLLSAKRDYDIFRGTTSAGPHRDDILLSVGGLSAREYASQGQQRSVAVALKLAEIELMEEASGEPPVVLLDDVMAELDENRRNRILDFTLGKCQTFITTTDLNELPDSVRESAGIFEVEAGTVKPI